MITEQHTCWKSNDATEDAVTLMLPHGDVTAAGKITRGAPPPHPTPLPSTHPSRPTSAHMNVAAASQCSTVVAAGQTVYTIASHSRASENAFGNCWAVTLWPHHMAALQNACLQDAAAARR